MTDSTLRWKIEVHAGTTTVSFSGDVDETADFAALSEALTGKVVFDLEKVRRLNSEGIRRWINFVRRLDTVVDLTYVRCSVPVVSQMNLIRGFQGKGKVESFFVPYIGVQSGEEHNHLLRTDEVTDPLHPPSVVVDGEQLELDDVPERYFSFLLE